MKTLAACFLIFLSLIATTAFAPVRRKTCSCAADDGSCSAQVTCPKGCLAFCPSGNCRAVCVIADGNGLETLSPTSALTLKVSTNRDVEAEKLRRSNTEILPARINQYPALDFAVQNTTHRDARQKLVSNRANYIDGEELADLRSVRRALLAGERMSVCFGQVTATDLAGGLSSITGLDIRTEPKGAATLINYSGKGVTLKEMVAQVSALSGVRFSIR